MFTGVLPRELGVLQAPGGMPFGCRPIMEGQRERVLAEVLRAAGYATLGVSTNIWIAEYSGFATGFDEFHLTANRRSKGFHDGRLRSRIAWEVQGVLAHVDDGAEEADGILRRHLESGPARPFFWFVNLSECHSPYLPPRPYDDLPIRQRLKATREARQHLTDVAIWRASLGGFEISDDAIARMRYLYGRSVLAMDDWMARLLERLDSRGLLDDTVVIVTSDHGENFGENRLIGHAFSLDDRLIHVPFIASHPEVVAGAGAKSLVDVPRIVAEIVGLNDHPWLAQESPADVAVAQLDPLLPPTDPRASKFVEDWALGDEGFRRLTTSATCATDGRFKLISQGGRQALYDLDADPLEAHPLDGRDCEDLPSVAALEDAVAESEHAPTDRPTSPEGTGVSTAEADEIAERMRTLGYL
jgi:arylsulfatase A-like enzyme